mgnify:CR=1 FL=1
MEYSWNVCSGICSSAGRGVPVKAADSGRPGSSDSAVTVLGMFAGAAACHNFGLAASGTTLNAETKELVNGAVPFNGKAAVIICIAVCFIIAFTNRRKDFHTYPST